MIVMQNKISAATTRGLSFLGFESLRYFVNRLRSVTQSLQHFAGQSLKSFTDIFGIQGRDFGVL